MDEIARWVDQQITLNDPAQAGQQGAVRLAEAGVALKSHYPGAMAFGLFLPHEGLAGSDEMHRRAKALLDEWIAGLDEDGKHHFRDVIGDYRADALGLSLPERVIPEVSHVVRVIYPVEVTKQDFDGGPDAAQLGPEVLSLLHGLRPGTGFEEIDDLPCFDPLEWLLGTRLSLRYDASAERLVCDLELDASSPPNAEDLEALRGKVSERLWDSGWSMNLEWETPAVPLPGFGPNHHAHVFVLEEPLGVFVREL